MPDGRAIAAFFAGTIVAVAAMILVPPLAARLTRGADTLIDGAMNDHAARRVVTGHDSAGQSVVLSDGLPPQIDRFGGVTFVEIWRTKSSPDSLTAGIPPEPTIGALTLRQRGGSVFRLVDYLPAREGGRRTEMHRTSTVDYCILLQGELVLILEGSEVTLKAGDVVVQRGTRHAWENRSDKPARMAFVMLDAAFAKELTDKLPHLAIEN